MTVTQGKSLPWCIVVADDHGPEWAPVVTLGEQPAPVQYCRLGGSTTLLQRALQRATRIAPVSQILVTALEEHRAAWEPSLWFVRPEHRFVCANRAAASMTTVAAILSVARHSPSQVVVMLPGRCHVQQEAPLRTALDRALEILPLVAEGAVTLAMIDDSEPIDEDYLLVGRPGSRPGLAVLGTVRRPARWVARHLQNQGALIASGIMLGYAGVFAAHISGRWPDLTTKLNRLVQTAAGASEECELSGLLTRGDHRNTLASLRWYAPGFAQRALCVTGCGWTGLHSARAVIRIRDYLELLANVASADGARPKEAGSLAAPVP